MLELQPPVSQKHARMSMQQRAAQFSPFAALTGYAEAIAEAGRLTEPLRELDDGRKEQLDHHLQKLQQRQEQRPWIQVTYFKPDHHKCGGVYVTTEGTVCKIDHVRRVLQLEKGCSIPIEHIFEISDR